MRVGILAMNFGTHGEATAAILWRDGFRVLGHEADIITMSASGKILAWMRKDCDVRCFSWKNYEDVARELSSYDILLSFGTGTLGEEEGVKPHYISILEMVDTPLYVYCTNMSHNLFRNYKNTGMFLTLPIVKGLMFSRDTTRASFVEGYPDIVRGKSILKTPHPFSFDPVIQEKLDGSIISTVALRPCKKVDKLLQAIEDHKLLESLAIFIWGAKDRSRYSWLLETKYGSTLDSIYLGPYEIQDLDDVYEDARFSIDLSFTKGDGGIQVSYLEAMSRSVVQIVSPGWDVEGTCIETPSLESADLADTLRTAALMSESDRLDLVKSGQSFIRANNAPEVVLGNFLTYFSVSF